MPDDTSFADFLEIDPLPTQRQAIPVIPVAERNDAAEVFAKYPPAPATVTFTQALDRGELQESLDYAQQSVRESLTQISNASQANAAVQGAGSLAGGQLRGVGFSTADGYITAIRNGVPGRTHAEYHTVLRTRFGKTSADMAALNLPGPMAATTLPDGPGIVHTPTGPSVFDQPRAARAFIVGPAAEEAAQRTADQQREHELQIRTGKQVIAGAVAEGHGVLLGWQGRGSLSRGVIVEALRSAGFDFFPKPTSARAQAGRALELATREGLVVRVQRGQATNTAAWGVGMADHQGSVGDKFGTTVLRVSLSATDALTIVGGRPVGAKIQADFDSRVSSETYQPADLTKWLSDRLMGRFDAVRMGLGFYAPSKHRERAEALCRAVAAAGFGADWILPAIPLATSDELREGIARGLQAEVGALLDNLRTERADALAELNQALTHDMHGIPVACGGKRIKMPKGDIGEKRAGTFLHDLREIGKRVAAYTEILGRGNTAGLRGRIQLAIQELEGVLGDDHTGISARFSAVWDEINLERRSEGGIL